MTEEKGPQMNSDALVDNSVREKQARLMMSVLGVLNLMTAFAAPNCLAQMDHSKVPTHEDVLALFDEFLMMFDRPDTASHDARVLIPMRQMRQHLETWPIASVAPSPVITTARNFLAAVGVPEPDEGWDQWKPPQEEMP